MIRAVLLSLLAVWPAPSLAQPGAADCGTPEFPAADSALNRLLPPLRSARERDEAIFEALGRSAWHPLTWDSVLVAVASQQGGVRFLAGSLLRTIHHGAPYHLDNSIRATAADMYGSLHRTYPDSAPLLPLVAMLADGRMPDEVKSGIARATLNSNQDIPALTKALAVELCRARLHLRPFVTEASISTSKRNLDWYANALQKAGSVARALRRTPQGARLLQEQLAEEPNTVLARWLADAGGRQKTTGDSPLPRREIKSRMELTQPSCLL